MSVRRHHCQLHIWLMLCLSIEFLKMMVSYMAAVGRRISRFILIYEQNIIADTYFVLLIKLKKNLECSL